jgi:3',5'-nucleoside bisphosphate phosphatase
MSPAPSFDLQSHSLHSDGELCAAAVVEQAATAGVELLALTDHDTVEGVDEALLAGARVGIEVVPAVEISTVQPDHVDLHVLGYRLDHHHPLLLERLAAARADRVQRAQQMAQTLRELGFAIDDAPLAARRAAGESIGRPHLASAVIADPANSERLAAERCGDVDRFIPAYLVRGAPAFVERPGPTVEQAIGWIHDAGGVAVWAHPFWDIADADEVLAAIDRFRASGLDGVEAFYVTHDAAQTRLIADRCAELGLLSTGSADFHGASHPRFHRFRAFELHGREPVLGRIRPR